MKPLLYSELTRWYHLLDPLEDHREEAGIFVEEFHRRLAGQAKTLLELGSGAGHNAYFIKQHFRCTLSDISKPMLDLSRTHNPDCEHIQGDMRTLRLDRQFDAVLIHDSVVYMSTLDDLRAAVETAFLHTRSGGVTIITPDCIKDSFVEQADLHQKDEGGLSLRCLEWSWDPDPSDSSYRVDFAFLLREGDQVESFHDTHTVGLFSQREWMAVLSEAGFRPEVQKIPFEDTDLSPAYWLGMFVCHKP